MRNSLIIGMALGAVLGAVLAEGNPSVSQMVSKGKKAVKSKIENMNQSPTEIQ